MPSMVDARKTIKPRRLPVPAILSDDPLDCYLSPFHKAVERPELGPLVKKAIERVCRELPHLLEDLIRSRCFDSAADLYDFEPALQVVLCREIGDSVTAALVQEAQDDPGERLKERREVITSSIKHLAAQRSNQPVTVTFFGGSSRRIRTRYGLRRPPRSRGRPRKPGRRGPSGNGIYAGLEVLGIHGGVTPALAGEVSRLVTTTTYERASAVLKRRGIAFGRDRVQRITQRVGDRGLQLRDWAANRLADRDVRGSGIVIGKRIVITTDGGRIRMRETSRRGRPKKSGRRGFTAAWREPKVFTIYEIDEKGIRKRKGVLRYGATMRDANGLFDLLVAKLREIGAHEAAAWIVTGDGADWIWNRVNRLVEEVGYERDKVTEVVDHYHAAEYIHEIAKNQKGLSDKEKAKWVKRMRRFLKKGKIEKILLEEPTMIGGSKEADEEQRKRFKYLADRIEKLRFGVFRSQGIPCGSGAVESAVRRIVNLRLKSPGIFWTIGMAEDVLHLRSELLAGQWDTTMKLLFENKEIWETDFAQRAA